MINIEDYVFKLPFRGYNSKRELDQPEFLYRKICKFDPETNKYSSYCGNMELNLGIVTYPETKPGYILQNNFNEANTYINLALNSTDEGFYKKSKLGWVYYFVKEIGTNPDKVLPGLIGTGKYNVYAKEIEIIGFNTNTFNNEINEIVHRYGLKYTYQHSLINSTILQELCIYNPSEKLFELGFSTRVYYKDSKTGSFLNLLGQDYDKGEESYIQLFKYSKQQERKKSYKWFELLEVAKIFEPNHNYENLEKNLDSELFVHDYSSLKLIPNYKLKDYLFLLCFKYLSSEYLGCGSQNWADKNQLPIWLFKHYEKLHSK